MWSFIELVQAYEKKDYDKFKTVHAKLFQEGDLDSQILLAFMAVSVDTDLAAESIQKIRKAHGDFPGLALLDALKCLRTRDIETAKSLIEKHKVLIEESLLGRTILALYHYIKNDYDKALVLLDALVEETPEVTFFGS